MKKILLFLFIPIVGVMVQCKQAEQGPKGSPITEEMSKKTVGILIEKYGEEARFRAERGVTQVASLWRDTDGDMNDFQLFCEDQFVFNPEETHILFEKLLAGYEILFGYFLRINKDLMRPLHLDQGAITPIDMMFGSFNASAHLSEDLFSNRIAFVTALNFPYFSLSEKTELGEKWSRKEWAYARMGDMFTSRVPAELMQNYSTISTQAEAYISQYNIYMGNLRNENGEKLFSDELVLISHWNLRDELKAQYANREAGFEKQKMVYEVMKRIIDQSIPEKVINSPEYIWKPISNSLMKDNEPVEFISEPNTRYQQILNLFNALKDMDQFNPAMPTYIQRTFEGSYELPVDDVEKLFIDLVSSKQVREVGKLISQRLGRPLEPFDIWYDGFKSRSGISAQKLDAVVSKRFTSAQAFEKEIPNILTSLGWSKEKANFFASKIVVEGSRGAGHAWGGAMRSDVALLRTRIGSEGMNYQGFNIAMHEFGHAVEQTITLHDVDYYALSGVPNTAFTEALAFIFQKRDMEVLNIKDTNPDKDHLLALDILWSCYEIMGVSLVDINLWKWLYENPNANAQQVKETAIRLAKEVWNKYYADVFGTSDETILAIYSHMVDSPLYLSAYPIGHLISFQLEQHVANKHFANEIQRIFEQGKIVPQLWMKNGVGEPLTNEPILKASELAVEKLK